MEGIIIDVSQSSTSADYEIADVHLYAAADNPVTVTGVPAKPGGCAISAIALVVTNADGMEATYACLKTTDGYTAVVPASHLATYGEIEKGIRVMATGTYGGAAKTVCLGIAKLTVVSGAAWAEPGTGSGVSGVMEGTTLATATLADLKLAVKQIGQVLGATVAALAVMCCASLGAATVTKAPLKSLLIDNASVVTDVDLSGTDSAKRLETADGFTWIDGDGNVNQVQMAAEYNGMTAAANLGSETIQWIFADPTARSCVLYWDAPSDWTLKTERMEDVENAEGEIVQESVARTYTGTAAWPCDSVTLVDGDGISVTVALRTATNIVNRVAFTNDVPNVAGGGISTNDVCNIVTNEVAGWTEWTFTPNDPTLEYRVTYFEGLGKWGFEAFDDVGVQIADTPDPESAIGGVGVEAGPDAETLTFTNVLRLDCTPSGIPLTATRERIRGRNALGLATLKDLEGKADASITNEIEEIKTESALIYRLYSGSNIIMEVTNYNSRVNPPEMRLMRLNDEMGAYDVMWTETNGLERTYQRAVSNTTAQVEAAAAELAPRAWSKVTSGLGSEAPANTTWISTPQLVVAGGLEFQKVITSRGDLWFLSGNGMMSSIGANEGGFFEISAADGTPVFSIEKTDSYLVGVDADSITKSGDTVTVTLSVVSEDHPLMRYTQTLDSPITWQKEEDGFTSPISVAWSGSSGAWTATVTTTASSGYFTFEFLQEGGVKLKSGGAMDVTSGGILCTDGIHKCRPVYNNGTITWEAF